MNYYLIQEGDIDNPIQFNTIPGLEELKLNKIDSIDKFTGIFTCYSDLKDTLYSYNLLRNDKEVKICYQLKGQIKSIKYGIVFADGFKFINYDNILAFLYRNRNNLDLMNAILNKEEHENEHNQFYALYKLKNHISYLSNNPASLDDGVEIEYEFSNFFRKYVDFKVKKKNSKGEYITRYTELRKLGLFLVNQAKKNEKLDTTTMDYVDNPIKIQPQMQKVKKRTKNKHVEGQYTLPGFEELM